MTMDEEDLLDEEPQDDDDAGDDGSFETEVGTACPHCGAPVTLVLDPAGGRVQEYVEDCEVCCRPWKVQLHYDAKGSADVQLEGLE